MLHFSCVVIQGVKIETLYANFVAEVMKTNKEMAKHIFKALAQCKEKPKKQTEEPTAPTETISLFDNEVSEFGIADADKKVHDALLKRAKCAFEAIENIVGAGELNHVYQKLRSDVRAILENDLKQCAKEDSIIMRV